MSLKSLLVSIPFLWHGATALPAGLGPWNSTTIPSNSSDFSAAAAYNLIDTYDASNWANKFNFEDISDPTHGFVDYTSLQEAQQLGLFKTQNGQVYMGVDSTSRLDPNGVGRKSIRVKSKTAYNRALVIADLAHIPGSACGSWPAFWMFGPNWPNQGEIDIIEGVHLSDSTQVTLHTSPGCTPGIGPGGETGRRLAGDCGADGGFNGCGVAADSPGTFGTPFNANGGGVYAMLWTSSGIKVWYFAARNVPANIKSGTPDPSTWGTPIANFGNGGCDFDARFRDLNIVFNITFCGDWAGGVWGSTTCAQVNPSCPAYVASQPQNFTQTYWLINSVKVYSV